MRILFFDCEFPTLAGGVGSTTLYLLQEYARNPEIRVDFVTASTDNQYHLLKMGENIMIHQLPTGKKDGNINHFTNGEMIRYAWRAYKFSLVLAKENKLDLSHSSFSFSASLLGLSSLLLNRKIKLPYVISLQGFRMGTVRGGLFKAIVVRIWKNASFVFADNAGLRESVLAFFPQKEIGLVEKGVDVESFFPDVAKRKADQFVILCEGEVSPVKGVRFLIQAFKILSGRYDQARLVVVGEGSDKKSLEDLVQGLDLKNKVEFVGEISQEKLLECYQGADVFVLPSLDQQADNGIAIRRALASALPIVATPVNGVEGLVVDQVNGFLVGINTADDLVEKIEKILLDENLRTSMSKNSHELAQKLSWGNVAQKYLGVYVETKNISHIQG